MFESDDGGPVRLHGVSRRQFLCRIPLLEKRNQQAVLFVGRRVAVSTVTVTLYVKRYSQTKLDSGYDIYLGQVQTSYASACFELKNYLANALEIWAEIDASSSTEDEEVSWAWLTTPF